jgi:hypothetical protein
MNEQTSGLCDFWIMLWHTDQETFDGSGSLCSAWSHEGKENEWAGLELREMNVLICIAKTTLEYDGRCNKPVVKPGRRKDMEMRSGLEQRSI